MVARSTLSRASLEQALGDYVAVPVRTVMIVATSVFVLVAIAAIAARTGAMREPAIVPTEHWSWDAAGPVVEALGPSPIHTGDRVVAMAGLPTATWAAELPERMSSTDFLPDPLEMVVVRADAAERLTVPLTPFPVAERLLAEWPLLVFMLAQLGIAVFLVTTRAPHEAIAALLVGSAANLGSGVPWTLAFQPSDLVTVGASFWLFLIAGPLSLAFWSSTLVIATTFPRRAARLRTWPLAVPAMWLLPQVVLVALVAGSFVMRPSDLVWVGSLPRLLAVVLAPMLVAFLLVVAGRYRSAEPAIRQRVRWVVLASTAAAALVLVLTVVPVLLGGFPVATRAILAVVGLTVPATLCLAILRERLFEVRALRHQREALVTAREEERRRLRRELHDGIGPTLAALTLLIDATRDLVRSEPDAAERQLDVMKGHVSSSVQDIRRIVDELRPPALDELGLVGALRQRADGFQASGVLRQFEFTIDPDPLPPLPAAVEVAAYRIASEAITNAVRHAQATDCRVNITVDEALRLEVVDDGRGVPAGRAPGVGMTAMRERATELGGRLEIVSPTVGGTIVRAWLPVAR